MPKFSSEATERPHSGDRNRDIANPNNRNPNPQVHGDQNPVDVIGGKACTLIMIHLNFAPTRHTQQGAF